MPTPCTCQPDRQTSGIVQSVDLINRELAALVGGVVVNIDVPPGCPIVLHGEPVKLRMVQPGDAVRVIYAEVRNSLVARTVEVQPGLPVGRLTP